MKHIKEILPDKINVVNESGDVVPHEGYFDNDYEPSEIEPLQNGASVELGARAIALMKIMDGFNQQSKLRGISQASMYTDFNERYKDRSSSVISGVASKAKEATRSLEEAVNVVSAEEELVQAGFTPMEARQIKRSLRRDLENKFGPGNSNYAARKKVTQKALRSAIISKKTE